MGASTQVFDLPTILGEDLRHSSSLHTSRSVLDAAHIPPYGKLDGRGRAPRALVSHPPASRDPPQHRHQHPPAALLAGIVPLPALLESMGAPCSAASDCKTDLVRAAIDCRPPPPALPSLRHPHALRSRPPSSPSGIAGSGMGCRAGCHGEGNSAGSPAASSSN
jgi:hypothetical protein